MTILLTNDDGWDSPGLTILAEELETAGYSVWVLAPDGERSGTSHSISLHNTVRVASTGPRSFKCSGTPADCVLFALRGVVPEPIDLVISGINRGPNIGTDIIYSGTAAAARQSALMETPALALSLNSMTPPYRYREAAQWLAARLESFHDLLGSDHFLNINFPAALDKDCPHEVTFPSKRLYGDELVELSSPEEGRLYRLQGTSIKTSWEEGSDWFAVSRNKVSVTPVFLHPVVSGEGNHG